MNEALKAYALLSNKMLLHLKQGIPENNSDNYLKKLEDLFNERDKLIKQINPPTTEEEKQLGNEMMQINKEIEQLTKAMYLSVQQKMTQMKKRQQTSNLYANPYEGFSVDGTFYDERN